MPLFAATLNNLRTRKLTGTQRGYFLANRYPLSDHEGAASVLDDLGRRIATERAKHGFGDVDPERISAIRRTVKGLPVFEDTTKDNVTFAVYRNCPCCRREGEDLWSFAARAVG